MSASSNKQKVEYAYGAYLKGDPTALLALFDDNSILIEARCLPYAGTFRGPKEVRKALEGIAAAWKEAQFDILEIVAGEKIVVAYGRFTGTAAKTGRRVDYPLAEVWVFENDRLVTVSPMYFDITVTVDALINSPPTH